MYNFVVSFEHLRVYLLQEMLTKNNNEMLNWSKIATLIIYGNAPPSLAEMHRSHTATKFKITFVDYHYHILDQLYRPDETPTETDTPMWARAEMNSIVYSLYSALDSLANEINLAYGFGIGENKIHIFHSHLKFDSDCLRCNLDKQNDKLTSALNHELGQSWFLTFNKLRNQITHKNLPLIGMAISTGDPATPDNAIHLTIPEDPTETNVTRDTKRVEINRYCLDLRNNVVKVAENTFDLLEPPIKKTFGL
jgi:hypothetical protein